MKAITTDLLDSMDDAIESEIKSEETTLECKLVLYDMKVSITKLQILIMDEI